jgi:hypothetical protein
LGMGTGSTIALAVVLAFFFGFLLTMMRHQLPSWRSLTTP